jgi:hypothetical protein
LFAHGYTVRVLAGRDQFTGALPRALLARYGDAQCPWLLLRLAGIEDLECTDCELTSAKAVVMVSLDEFEASLFEPASPFF